MKLTAASGNGHGCNGSESCRRPAAIGHFTVSEYEVRRSRFFNQALRSKFSARSTECSGRRMASEMCAELPELIP